MRFWICEIAFSSADLACCLSPLTDRGRSYASTLVIREGHRLVAHGIYRFTQRPRYLGAIMTGLGLPVYVSSLFGLLFMSALIPVFPFWIRIEARMLIEAFGNAYRTFQGATGKQIPFIYCNKKGIL